MKVCSFMIDDRQQMINMGDNAAKKGRFKLFELKMENSQRSADWIPRSNSLRGRTNAGACSYASERIAKLADNPQEKVEKRDPHARTSCTGKDFNKISNVVFTLPEIKTTGFGPELTQSLLFEEEKIASYCSAKLEPSLHQKTSKSITSRYYRQIEVLKEVREPVVSQKTFTIMNLQNQNLDEAKLQNNLALITAVKARQKKAPFPSSALDRYQLVRDKEEIAVPLQLQAKRVVNRKTGELDKKGKVRVNLVKRKRISKQFDMNQGFKVEGWAPTPQGNFEY